MKPSFLFSHWQRIRKGLIEVIEKFEEKDLDYQATSGGWPAGQIMIHIANAEDGWFRYAVTKEYNEWPSYLDYKKYPDKDGNEKDVLVTGWVDHEGDDRYQWREEYSDHALLYFEVQKPE